MTQSTPEPIPTIILGPDDPSPTDLEPGTQVFRRVDTTAAENNGVLLPDGCLGQHWPESDACSQHLA